MEKAIHLTEIGRPFLDTKIFNTNLVHFLLRYHVMISNESLHFNGHDFLHARICTLNGFVCTKSREQKIIIYESQEGDLKMKFCVKRLYNTESIKYLGVRIYTNLSWQYGVNDISIKLNRANALLFKMRKQYTLVLKY